MNLLILSISQFLHILATVVWIGGIVMILLVILPAAKATLESPSMQNSLMKNTARRFTPMANISILVLIITGIAITYFEKNFAGFLNFNNPWNVVIFLKHFLVILMIIIHFYRGLILTPKIGRLSAQGNESQKSSSTVVRLQKLSLNLVKTNFVLGLIVLLLSGILSSL